MEELRDKINEVLSEAVHDSVKLNLLINILVYPGYKNMTIEQTINAELKAKKEFNAELVRRAVGRKAKKTD